MSIDEKTMTLYDFMESKFPSQQMAVRAVWSMDVSELPDAIRLLSEDERESLVACYPEHIFLTMEHYPEQLMKGYLWLTSCEPCNPSLSTSYARRGEPFFVGVDFPNFGYGYSQIEIQRKQINYKDEADRDSRKPLFVPISKLRTNMPERLEHYREFQSCSHVTL